MDPSFSLLPSLVGERALELLLVYESFPNQEVSQTSANGLTGFRVRHLRRLSFEPRPFHYNSVSFFNISVKAFCASV